jgi:hemerythrin-like domain-containing protein
MTPTQRAPARTPDITLFTVLHRAMRRDAGRLADAVAVAAPGDGHRLAALSRWYRSYRSELADHHRVEDELFFPVLADRVPSFTAHMPRVEAEHHMLEDALGGVQAALDALAAGTGPRSDAVAATRELRDLLDSHLGFEDADVVPLYVRHFSADEYAEVGERALKMVSKANLVFAIPWAMSAATDAERSHMLGEVPLAFRLLWYASRRRYARLDDRALGRISPAAPAPAAGRSIERQEVA